MFNYYNGKHAPWVRVALEKHSCAAVYLFVQRGDGGMGCEPSSRLWCAPLPAGSGADPAWLLPSPPSARPPRPWPARLWTGDVSPVSEAHIADLHCRVEAANTWRHVTEYDVIHAFTMINYYTGHLIYFLNTMRWVFIVVFFFALVGRRLVLQYDHSVFVALLKPTGGQAWTKTVVTVIYPLPARKKLRSNLQHLVP